MREHTSQCHASMRQQGLEVPATQADVLMLMSTHHDTRRFLMASRRPTPRAFWSCYHHLPPKAIHHHAPGRLHHADATGLGPRGGLPRQSPRARIRGVWSTPSRTRGGRHGATRKDSIDAGPSRLDAALLMHCRYTASARGLYEIDRVLRNSTTGATLSGSPKSRPPLRRFRACCRGRVDCARLAGAATFAVSQMSFTIWRGDRGALLPRNLVGFLRCHRQFSCSRRKISLRSGRVWDAQWRDRFLFHDSWYLYVVCHMHTAYHWTYSV